MPLTLINHPDTLAYCPYCKTRTSNSVTEYDELVFSKRDHRRIFYKLICRTCDNFYFLYEDIKQKHLLKDTSIPSVNKTLNSQWGVDNQRIIYPQQIHTTQIPAPSKYMPEDVKKKYEEAANVFEISPRSAAALIRLTLELLLKRYLVNDGRKHSLNEMIGMLSANTPSLVMEFMDLIRDKGNSEVHPELEKLEHEWGDITREPDKDEILYLFKYINIICGLIGLSDKANEDFESLPEEKRLTITKRNKKYQE